MAPDCNSTLACGDNRNGGPTRLALNEDQPDAETSGALDFAFEKSHALLSLDETNSDKISNKSLETITSK